jgi:hypothetical protein
MTDSGGRDKPRNTLHHPEPGAQDGDERQLLTADLHPGHPLEWRVHRYWLE